MLLHPHTLFFCLLKTFFFFYPHLFFNLVSVFSIVMPDLFSFSCLANFSSIVFNTSSTKFSSPNILSSYLHFISELLSGCTSDQPPALLLNPPPIRISLLNSPYCLHHLQTVLPSNSSNYYMM